MRTVLIAAAIAAAFAFAALPQHARARDDDSDGSRGARLVEYEVSITNLTRNQQFTPFLVVTHRPAVRLFETGEPASPELATLAEEGNTGPLADRLRDSDGVRDVETSSGLLDTGRTVNLRITGVPFIDRISLAAMLIPTNDGFTALSAVDLPLSGSADHRAPAYDAGSERNDELCASIPGPDFFECGGPGGGDQVEGGEEGFVHIHSGIHGIGDLVPAERDWRNPVARVSIRRIAPSN